MGYSLNKKDCCFHGGSILCFCGWKAGFLGYLTGFSFVISLILFFCRGITLAFSYENEPGKKTRVISLAPSTTEILFALGLDDNIVGISSFCNYPQETENKEKVGAFSSPNIEKILSLKPDIIFCTGLQQAPAAEKLSRLGIKVYVSDPSSIAELFESIRQIASLTHSESEADELIHKMKDEIEEVRSSLKGVASGEMPKVFVEIWSHPLMTAGKGSLIDELITLAGGINIAYDTEKTYSYFTSENVIKRDPDCIILGYMQEEVPLKMLKGRFGWQEIAAVKNNRVYNDVDPDTLFRPGPRLTEGLKEIHKRLYPGEE